MTIEVRSSEGFELGPTQANEYPSRVFYKTLLVNLIVLCSLLLALELSYRLWLYFRNCDTVCYDTTFFTKLDVFNRSLTHVYGFLAPDPITGYSPADGTFVIHEPGWNNATITIRNHVRVHMDVAPTSAEGAILAVGDSYVFGDQVSDDETWPAILERRLNRHVVNGGVSGYGTAQAVLRAEHLLKAQPYSLVVLSILVAGDLLRDRAVNVYDNFYRPVVIREDGRLRQTTLEESRRIASQNFICAHPWLPEMFFWSHIAKRFFSPLGYDGRCTGIDHPRGASDREILEFAVGRLAAFPVNKLILIQYHRGAFVGPASERASIEQEARMIRDSASRHGVPVIDTYDTLKSKPPREIYIYSNWWPHHSKIGNELVADSIARNIATGGLMVKRD